MWLCTCRYETGNVEVTFSVRCQTDRDLTFLVSAGRRTHGRAPDGCSSTRGSAPKGPHPPIERPSANVYGPSAPPRECSVRRLLGLSAGPVDWPCPAGAAHQLGSAFGSSRDRHQLADGMRIESGVADPFARCWWPTQADVQERTKPTRSARERGKGGLLAASKRWSCATTVPCVALLAPCVRSGMAQSKRRRDVENRRSRRWCPHTRPKTSVSLHICARQLSSKLSTTPPAAVRTVFPHPLDLFASCLRPELQIQKWGHSESIATDLPNQTRSANHETSNPVPTGIAGRHASLVVPRPGVLDKRWKRLWLRRAQPLSGQATQLGLVVRAGTRSRQSGNPRSSSIWLLRVCLPAVLATWSRSVAVAGQPNRRCTSATVNWRVSDHLTRATPLWRGSHARSKRRGLRPDPRVCHRC